MTDEPKNDQAIEEEDVEGHKSTISSLGTAQPRHHGGAYRHNKSLGAAEPRHHGGAYRNEADDEDDVEGHKHHKAD